MLRAIGAQFADLANLCDNTVSPYNTDHTTVGLAPAPGSPFAKGNASETVAMSR